METAATECDEDSCTETVNDLAVHLAVIEIVEVLLAVQLQKGNDPKSGLLKVSIGILGHDLGLYNWYFIHIMSHARNIQSFHFGQVLLDHGTNVCKVLSAMESLYSGRFLRIQLSDGLFEVRCSGGKLELIHSSSCDASGSQCTGGISLTCKVLQTVDHMNSESRHINSYMHRFKLLHPRFPLKFSAKCSPVDTQFATDYEFDGCVVNFKNMHIATDIRHYKSVDNAGKLKPWSRSGQVVSIDVDDDAAAAAAAPLQSQAAAAIILSTSTPTDSVDILQCTQFKMFIYGPCGFPIGASIDSLTCLSPLSLVQLDEYNVTLGPVAKTTTDAVQLGLTQVCGDWQCQLKPTPASNNEAAATTTANNETAATATTTAAAAASNEPELASDSVDALLCVWLSIGLQPAEDIQQNLATLRHLRDNFTELFSRLQPKLRQATSTALQRLQRIHTSRVEKQQLLESVLPTMMSALSGIVTSSTNISFRNRCLNRMKVADTSELPAAITDKLWELAVSVHGVTRPANTASQAQSSTIVPATTTSTTTRRMASKHSRARPMESTSDRPLPVDSIIHQTTATAATVINAAASTLSLARPVDPTDLPYTVSVAPWSSEDQLVPLHKPRLENQMVPRRSQIADEKTCRVVPDCLNVSAANQSDFIAVSSQYEDRIKPPHKLGTMLSESQPSWFNTGKLQQLSVLPSHEASSNCFKVSSSSTSGASSLTRHSSFTDARYSTSLQERDRSRFSRSQSFQMPHNVPSNSMLPFQAGSREPLAVSTPSFPHYSQPGLSTIPAAKSSDVVSGILPIDDESQMSDCFDSIVWD